MSGPVAVRACPCLVAPAAALAHSVELLSLLGRENALELLVSAVADCAGDLLDRIHLRTKGCPQCAHLCTSRSCDRIELRALCRCQLQLPRHPVERRTPARVFLARQHPIGGEA